MKRRRLTRHLPNLPEDSDPGSLCSAPAGGPPLARENPHLPRFAADPRCSLIAHALTSAEIAALRKQAQEPPAVKMIADPREQGRNELLLLSQGRLALSDIISGAPMMKESISRLLHFLGLMLTPLGESSINCFHEGEAGLPVKIWAPIFSSRPAFASDRRQATGNRLSSWLRKKHPDAHRGKQIADCGFLMIMEEAGAPPRSPCLKTPLHGSRALATVSPCARQRAHADWPPSKEKFKRPGHFGALSAADPMSLRAWEGAHSLISEDLSESHRSDLARLWPSALVKAPPYSVIIARGDAPHAGESLMPDPDSNGNFPIEVERLRRPISRLRMLFGSMDDTFRGEAHFDENEHACYHDDDDIPFVAK